MVFWNQMTFFQCPLLSTAVAREVSDLMKNAIKNTMWLHQVAQTAGNQNELNNTNTFEQPLLQY